MNLHCHENLKFRIIQYSKLDNLDIACTYLTPSRCAPVKYQSIMEPPNVPCVLHILLNRSRYSEVCSGLLWAEQSGVRTPLRQDIFFSPDQSRHVLGSIQPILKWVPGPFPGIKRQRRGVDHPPFPSAEPNNEQNYTFTTSCSCLTD